MVSIYPLVKCGVAVVPHTPRDVNFAEKLKGLIALRAFQLNTRFLPLSSFQHAVGSVGGTVVCIHLMVIFVSQAYQRKRIGNK